MFARNVSLTLKPNPLTEFMKDHGERNRSLAAKAKQNEMNASIAVEATSTRSGKNHGPPPHSQTLPLPRQGPSPTS